jgi:hypothetical protein
LIRLYIIETQKTKVIYEHSRYEIIDTGDSTTRLWGLALKNNTDILRTRVTAKTLIIGVVVYRQDKWAGAKIQSKSLKQGEIYKKLLILQKTLIWTQDNLQRAHLSYNHDSSSSISKVLYNKDISCIVEKIDG